MAKTGKQNRDTNNVIREMNENIKIIAMAAGIATIIVGIITVFVTFIPKDNSPTEGYVNESAIHPITAEPYEIYLYPEYRSFEVGFHNDMTASLNFDTDSVSITAYLIRN